MKKTIALLAAALVLMSAFAACGRRMDLDENVTPNIAPNSTTVPKVTAAPATSTAAPTAMPKATVTPAPGNNGNADESQKGGSGADSDNILQDAGEELEQAGDKLEGDAGVVR